MFPGLMERSFFYAKIFLIPLLIFLAIYDLRKKEVPLWAIYPFVLGVVIWRKAFLYAAFFLLGEKWPFFRFFLFPLSFFPAFSPVLFLWTILIYFYYFMGGRGIGGGDIWVLILLTGFFPEPGFLLLLSFFLLLYSLPRLIYLWKKGGPEYIYFCLLQDVGNPQPLEGGRPCIWVYSLSGIVYSLFKFTGG
ncbi:MAG: prepilin peptidase [Candidatus Hadarchaeales archaeon]